MGAACYAHCAVKWLEENAYPKKAPRKPRFRGLLWGFLLAFFHFSPTDEAVEVVN